MLGFSHRGLAHAKYCAPRAEFGGCSACAAFPNCTYSACGANSSSTRGFPGSAGVSVSSVSVSVSVCVSVWSLFGLCLCLCLVSVQTPLQTA